MKEMKKVMTCPKCHVVAYHFCRADAQDAQAEQADMVTLPYGCLIPYQIPSFGIIPLRMITDPSED